MCDCNGACAPAAWVGDGYCDNGVALGPEDFDCAQFAYDGGDCAGGTGDTGVP